MKLKGGNTDELYKQDEKFDGRLEMAKSLRLQHPDVTKITRKWGRWQHQVDYRPFKKNKLILKPGIEIPQGINEYGMILKENLRMHRVLRKHFENLVIYSLYFSDKKHSEYLKLRKTGGSLEITDILRLEYIEPICKYIKEMGFGLITNPPQLKRKENKKGLIQEISEQISNLTGIPFRVLFALHSQNAGSLATKLQRNHEPFELKEKVTDKFILLLDDFLFTGLTMYKAYKALINEGNRVYPMALCG